MATPLLTTKLYIPQLRSTLISRPRLLERLDEGQRAGYRLTLVSAPAGFGKTMLLSEWVASSRRPVAWLSLDEGDNDPARFLAHFVAAIQTIHPDIGQSIYVDAQLSQPPQIQAILTNLINQIATLPGCFALVLDDYHLVTAQPIHDGLTFLLDHLPPQMHLIIATRADPPLPIPRLRATGQLAELRQADLRFTQAEAAAFLQRIGGLDLSAEDVAALAHRTEGWIAGLQMAAVSMRQRDDLSSFVRAFAGSHRYVMDYLMEEVLQGQPADVQIFLLHTSVLERLCAPLCDAVLPEHPRGAQSALEYLEQANLFVTPLDDCRTWYRYHRLFADLLQGQLAKRHPDVISDLHRRASAWYEDHELLPESIDHALAAGDAERAATLIEQIVEPLLMSSQVVTLRKWLDALPEGLLDRHPGLCAYHAWLLLLAGEPLRAVESRIAAVGEGIAAGSGQLQAMRALIALFQTQIERAIALAEDAWASLTEEDGFWYGMVQWLWNVLQMSSNGDRGEDVTSLERLIRSQFEHQNVLLATAALCNLGELRLKQGRLRDAETLFRRALAQATDAQGEHLPIAGEPLVWLGELARERNDLLAAERCLSEGIELITKWGRIAAMDGYVALARLRQAQGDENGTVEAIEQAERLAVMFDATDMDDHIVAMCRGRIAALRGDWAGVQRWVESRGLDALDPDNLQIDATIELHVRKYELATLGLARILEGRPHQALTFLEPLLSEVAARARWGLGIEILALQAAAHHVLGETALALDCLERAMARAEPEGYVRLYLEIGEPMAQLLYEAAQRGIYPEYAGRLLAAFPSPSEEAAALRQTETLIEPLSERELEVLTAIAEGLSNQEVAERLYISERTVKWHTGNIYGKLQVGNRTEAVAKGRALGILAR